MSWNWIFSGLFYIINKKITLLNEIQCDALKKLGLDNIKSFMDIIEILPEYIEEPEIGRFEYELIIRKNEICYESYDYNGGKCLDEVLMIIGIN